MSSTRTNVTKRACDGCKIRKIRCGGGQPCKACSNARIKCTYIRVQQPRGPQRLRSATRLLIEQTQRGHEGVQNGSSLESASQDDGGQTAHPSQCNVVPAERSRIPTNVLAPPLYIYHVRMYPVWPIVNVEEVVSALQRDTEGEDLGTYVLATAIAAATIAQLRLGQSSTSDTSISAADLAAECLRARNTCNYRSSVSLNGVRTSFFLHIYYENQQSGGSESLLYLREAISLAQMLNLHRESSYTKLPEEEQQLRRRVLWLLFVTERGVCILHRYPVVLKANISPPEIDANDDSQVLPAFLKLLNLFRLFEQSRMFDIIQDEDPEFQSLCGMSTMERSFLEALQRQLQEGSILFDQMSDVQKADLCVTRHWMRMILWKLSSRKGSLCLPSSERLTSLCFPVTVAKELLSIVSQLPRSAIEAHGLGMELKIYEIANSLADAVMDLSSLPRPLEWDLDSRPSSILARFHSILSTFRGGGNKTLVDMLYKKMAEAQLKSTSSISSPLKSSCLDLGGNGRRPRKRLQAFPQATHERATPTDSTFILGQTGPASAVYEDCTNGPTVADGSMPFTLPNFACGAPAEISVGASPQLIEYSVCGPLPFHQFSQSSADPGYIVTTAPPRTVPDASEDLPMPQFPTSLSPPNWSPWLPMELLIGDFVSSIPEPQPPGPENLDRLPMTCADVSTNANVNGREFVETYPA